MERKKNLLMIKHPGSAGKRGKAMSWLWLMAASGIGSLIFIDDVTHDGSSRINSKTFCLPIYRELHLQVVTHTEM